ncbi:MAG: anti-sigma factor [Pseudomonadales bacterium]|nr:anti-sigma factor [Pseudomonadales bacterium]
MNYLIPERLEALAGAYVLGTLHGLARKRFERVLMESYRARQAVWDWEQKLNPMVESVAETVPPERIWSGIQRRINPQQSIDTVKQDNLLSSLMFWRRWGGVSTVVAIVLALFISLYFPFTPALSGRVAIFNDAQNQPLWLVSSDLETGKLKVKAINAEAVAIDNKAFELWMLPASGQPRSLGLLPVTEQRVEVVLSPQLLAILQNTAGLAVSVEPPGGSPTGLPTGPVVYQTRILEL